MYSQTNSQALKPDEQVSFRLVELNRARFWQASNGRTFPVIAGAEDPPVDEHSDENGSHDDEELPADVVALRKENAKWRTQLRDAQEQLKELGKLKAEDRQRREAEMSEVERLKTQQAEAERKAQEAERKLIEAQIRQSIERAAAKAGAADPEDVYALLKPSDFDLDADGVIKNADKLVDSLLKGKPYLVAKGTNGVPATPRSNGAQTHEDRVSQNKQKLAASGDYDRL